MRTMASMYISAARRRGHELGTDRIGDRRAHDALNQLAVGAIERPSSDAERRFHLIGVAAAPERDVDSLVEHPTYREVNHAPLKAPLWEAVELVDGAEILGIPGRLEFGVNAPQIIAAELRVLAHPPAQ